MDQRKYSRPAPREDVTAGRNAVRELLLSGKSVDRVFAARGDGKLGEIVALAKEAGVPVIDTERAKLDAMCPGIPHQGVAAVAAAHEFSSLEDVFALAEKRGEKPLIAICDGVEDPHNLGAIIRCAECSGAHGVVIPKRRSVGLNATVAKASAGAIEYVPVVRVGNIPETIEKLKKKGVWVYAAEAGGSTYYDVDLDRPVAIVFGSEGRGVSDLSKKRCDGVISIPLFGKINSLNVSAAAAVLLCHAAVSQREGGVDNAKKIR
ncbi:MAG: 23S rRNA (guanosine(2251)-2'-O)-methyltransferase RlmB [Clostridia bacterium]|nr:23S rRNA (guanosine(2251)-2'-O)-methyltransferase RlmB [Clostridia bacterium]MBR7032402.1 23S rRNA (guanosine(2251)-2'-O)-methyltransferase RlmB [Clostridia bacterium]